MDAFFENLKEKLNSKSERGPQGDTCVYWRGRISSSGYGLQTVYWPEEGRKVEKAHRVALMADRKQTRSQFPRDSVECSHLCHHKLCVNPQHLVLESHSVNQERNHCQSQGLCSKSHLPWCIICNYSLHVNFISFI